MSEPFISEIRMFGCGYAPRNWALCDGSLLPLYNHQALFALIGSVFGGDGRTTVGLPDLAGRAPMHAGQAPGLSARYLGEKSGSISVALNQNQMPAHNHLVNVNSATATSEQGENMTLAKGERSTGPAPSRPLQEYNDYVVTNRVTMASAMLSSSGGTSEHFNMQPYITVNFCIALEGIFPARS